MMEFQVRLYELNSADSHFIQVHINGEELLGNNGLRLPLNDLHIEIGGHNEDRIKLQSQKTGTVIICEDRRILEMLAKSVSNPELREKADKALHKLHSNPAANRRYWTIVVSSLVAIVVGGYLMVDVAANAIVDRIDPKVEAKIGEVLCGPDTRKTTKNPALEKRVQDVGNKLASQLKDKRYEYHFYVVDQDAVNACTYPGGYIIVNSGLLKASNTDDELAGVLGHEIGHVIHRDTLHGLAHNAGLLTCLGLLGSPDWANADKLDGALSVAQHLESLQFGRSQESKADAVGIRLAIGAGYSGDGMVKFFQKLQANPDSKDDKLTGLLSTHPLNEDRINAINAEIKKIKEQGPAGLKID